jgi:hypothetical protein
MVNVSVKIDPKSFEEFQRALEEFSTGLGKDFQDTAIQQAALLCDDALTLTPPMLKSGGGGKSKGAQRLGEEALKADVNSIVTTNRRTSRIVAYKMYRRLGDACYRNDQSQFYKTMNSADLSGIKNSIFIKISQDPDHARAFKKAQNLFAKFIPDAHLQVESQEGNIQNLRNIHFDFLQKFGGRRLRKKNVYSGSNWINRYTVMSQDIINKYVKERMQMVGQLKSAWSSLKRRLPPMKGKQIKFPGGKDPAWIARHNSTQYQLTTTLNDKVVQISITNNIGNNNNVASEANTKSLVYGLRIKKMTLDLEKQLAARANKFNKK